MSSPVLEKTATPGIYKRGSRYVVVYRDPGGRQRKQFARTLAEARDLKAALRADIARGEYRQASKITFAEYAASWISTYAGRTSRGIRAETLRDYRVRLGLDEDGQSTGKGAVGFFGRMRLASIEPRHIREFIAHTAERGVAVNTVRLELAPVKALFACALEDGEIRLNPCAGVRIAAAVSSDEDDRQAVKAPSPEEAAELLKQIDAQWKLPFEFLAETGLRIGEVVALRFQDVDMGQRRVNITRRWYRGSFGPPKSKYGRRSVPITPAMAQRLWAERGKRRARDSDLVFVSERGRMIDQSNLMSRVLKPAAVRAGLGSWEEREKGKPLARSWVGFHSFRHFCATELFRRGLNAKQVQLWLGHHSPAFTLDRYVHLLPDDLPASPFGAPVVAPVVGNTGATEATETHRNVPAVAVAG